MTLVFDAGARLTSASPSPDRHRFPFPMSAPHSFPPRSSSLLRILAALLVALCLAPLVTRAQTRLVEKVTPAAGQLVIPYSKYVLANGLTVIVHEDHSDPVVH